MQSQIIDDDTLNLLLLSSDPLVKNKKKFPTNKINKIAKSGISYVSELYGRRKKDESIHSNRWILNQLLNENEENEYIYFIYHLNMK